MRRDPTVIVMGEDIAGGAGAPGEDDAWGGSENLPDQATGQWHRSQPQEAHS